MAFLLQSTKILPQFSPKHGQVPTCLSDFCLFVSLIGWLVGWLGFFVVVVVVVVVVVIIVSFLIFFFGGCFCSFVCLLRRKTMTKTTSWGWMGLFTLYIHITGHLQRKLE
jgi:apolipoprotein N-acyltransferase